MNVKSEVFAVKDEPLCHCHELFGRQRGVELFETRDDAMRYVNDVRAAMDRGDHGPESLWLHVFEVSDDCHERATVKTVETRRVA